MEVLPPPEHDRDLDLRAMVEEANDVALLRLVVVDRNLRPELDLLDVNLGLMLPRELRLLLLLVAVLPVVHDLGDRRIRLGGHLDEVEPLGLGVGERLLGRLDPELRAVVVDEPDARHADVLVDPGLRDRTDGFDEPSRSQRAVTKLLVPPSENDKTVASMQRPRPLVFRLG